MLQRGHHAVTVPATRFVSAQKQKISDALKFAALILLELLPEKRIICKGNTGCFQVQHAPLSGDYALLRRLPLLSMLSAVVQKCTDPELLAKIQSLFAV